MQFVSVQSNAQIEAEERKKAQEAEARKPDEAVLVGLAGFLRKRWEQAKRAKGPIEQQMLKNKRARNGEYEPQKLAAIKVMFGNDYIPVYMMLTETKCRAAEAWIKDILMRPDAEPWDLEPTPIPELPQSVEKYINSNVVQTIFEMALSEAFAKNIQLDKQAILQKITSAMPIIKERVNKEVKKRAKEAAGRMKEKIADQFAEGGWDKALKECIYDVVTYKACILKGPVQAKESVRVRDINPISGQWENRIEERIISKYERRSPFDIYPAPDAIGIDDGYLFDKISLTRKDLSDLIGVPGYNVENIRDILREHKSGGLKEWTAIESERAQVEGRDSISVYESEKIDCLNYWGTAPGEDLIMWGLTEKEVPDALLEYNVCAWMIGNKIIKAMINPDPLGNKPYSKTSFTEDPDSWWGGSVPELINDIQQMCNAIARAIVNNVGIASGPQVEINKDRMAPGQSTDIHPWKKWLTTNVQMREGKAVEFYQPELVVEKLINLYEFCLRIADEDSGVPRYAHGETDVGGAGSTASGLSMLMTQSARGIKQVIKNIDMGLIAPSVERQYHFNLDYEDDMGLIGDLKVVAKGSSSLIAKEQQAIRRTEFMDRTAKSPIDTQILGIGGRKYLLEETAKSLEIDIDKLFEEYEFERKYAMTEQTVPQTAGEKPLALNQAGDQMGGQDFALFNQGKQ